MVPMMVPMIVLFASACDHPTDLPADLDPSYGTVESPYVDLGLHEPRPRAADPALTAGTTGGNAVLNGSFELHARQSDVRVHGTITCATVFGSTAWLGGTITTAGMGHDGRSQKGPPVDRGACGLRPDRRWWPP